MKDRHGTPQRKTMSSQSDMKYLLAGESGGTKTVLRLTRQAGGAVRKLETSGIACAKEGILPVMQTLSGGINELLKKAGIGSDRISHCYLSLGGPNQKEVEEALKHCLPSAKIAVGRETTGDRHEK